MGAYGGRYSAAGEATEASFVDDLCALGARRECWPDSTLGVLPSPMTGQPIAQLLPRKPRPQWIVPLVTALVFVAVILVLY
jgi:hypothetical protein